MTQDMSPKIDPKLFAANVGKGKTLAVCRREQETSTSGALLAHFPAFALPVNRSLFNVTLLLFA